MSLAKCLIVSYPGFYEFLTSYSFHQVLYMRVWVSDSCDDDKLCQAAFENHLPVNSKTERDRRKIFSVCSNIMRLRSRGLAWWLESVVAFWISCLPITPATPWGISSTVASLYSQHMHVFTQCQVDTSILPWLQQLVSLKCFSEGERSTWLDL